ncbi:MAG TPA: hypothetical protein VD713_03660, partial [Sphingomonadales bacterium]|nr:hypothetical protein [Sphingomonadales bacterium]
MAKPGARWEQQMIFLVLMLVAVAVLLVVAGALDLRSRRIPNWIPLSLFSLYLLFLATQYLFDFPVEPLHPIPSFTVGTAVAVLFALLFAL